MIKKQGEEYCVFSEDGNKKLGCYSSREEAQNRIAQVEKLKKESTSNHKYAYGGILEIKSLDEDLIVKGYIATTHRDSGNDVITKDALLLWAKEINIGLPRANKVTYHHDREDVRVVGVGIKGTARVEELPDGEFGLYVETKVNRTHPFADIIEYEYKNGMLDSFSIEYATPSGAKEDLSERTLDENTTLLGWTLASRPMNDNAVMIKEMITIHTSGSVGQGAKEETQMGEEKSEIDALKEQLKELQSQMTKLQYKEEEAQKKPEDEEESDDESEKKTQDGEQEEKEKAREEALTKEISEVKELIKSIKETKDAKMDNEKKESGVRVEYKEFADNVNKRVGYKEAAHYVGQYLSSRGLNGKEDFSDLALTKENSIGELQQKVIIKSVEGKEVVEFKALSVGDNENSNYVNATSTIGLSQAELQDVVMPVIFNALNESTVTWDLLAKDVGGSDGSNRVTFVLKTANTGAYFSTGNAIVTTQVGRTKYTTEYKKLYIGGAVDGDLQVYSKGGPFGEALALEMADRAIALKVKANQALFDENAGQAGEAAPLGIPAITDSSGNTSIYNTTRTAANKLAPDAAGDTYVDGSGGLTEALMRNAIEQATTDGSDLNDLIFVGTPAVINKYKALFDGRERLVPYSDRAGFKNAPDYEGVPLFADKDSKASSLFLIDKRALRIKIVQPMTTELLGKRSDSHEFFMKMYYAVFCTAPRRLVEVYSIA